MKVIGIVGRAYYNRDEQKVIQVNEAVRRLLSNYSDVVSVLLLPTNNDNYVDIKMGMDNISDIDKTKLDFMLDKCDGFIVPGGTYWYQFDEYVMKYAIKSKKPLLAICAGFQAMCSMDAKDRVRFDMTKDLLNDNHHNDGNLYTHENIIKKDTLLYDILKKDKIKVNSVHHSYVNFEMNDLIVSSVSEDGIIEAVELVKHPFFIGVEWHPEYLMDEDSRKIFDYFIDKTKELR